MKLDSINLQNFLGLHDFRHKPAAPILLIAGANGVGKSSLLDGIRFAIDGSMPRGVKATAEQRKTIITEGAAAGFAEVGADGYTAKRAIGSGNVTGDALAQYIGLDVALDPARFASMEEPARKRLLCDLMGVKADRETVAQHMKDAKVADNIIEKVMPLLRGGFDGVVTEARNKASEHRGAWKAIAGENYGSLKAVDWKPNIDVVAPDPDEIERMEHSVTVAKQRVEHLTGLAGRVRGAMSDERRAELEEQASNLEAAASDVTLANQAATEAADALRDLENVSRTADPMTCPCCQASVFLVSGELVVGQGVKKPTAAAIEKARKNRDAAEQAQREAAARHTKAVAAVAALDNASTVTAKEREEAAGLDEAKRQLSVYTQSLTSMLGAQDVLDNAALQETKAKHEHMLVAGWTQVQELCGPEGIPAILLARALDPFNDLLAKLANSLPDVFGPAAVERDLSLSYLKRAYHLNSESEQWRADLLFATAIAYFSRCKIIALDRFDVVAPALRVPIMDWLNTALIDTGVLDTVLVAATLKSNPAGAGFAGTDVLWLEKHGAIAQQAAA